MMEVTDQCNDGPACNHFKCPGLSNLCPSIRDSQKLRTKIGFLGSIVDHFEHLEALKLTHLRPTTAMLSRLTTVARPLLRTATPLKPSLRSLHVSRREPDATLPPRLSLTPALYSFVSRRHYSTEAGNRVR